jgi:DNA-binding MarR family transcriptional regulator
MAATRTRPDAVTVEVVELLFTVTQRFKEVFEQTAADHDLTTPQAVLLRMLRDPLPMRELASSMRCDASNITGLVDKLEARGLAERRAEPSDRRVKLVGLTAAGERVLADFESELYSGPAALESLGAAGRRELRDMLQRIADA